MKITLLTHYYPPEIGAPQARLSEMAKEWTKLGHNVTVITCFPNHPTGIIPTKYRKKRFLIEDIDNVKIIRTWVYATPNKGFLKKIIGHLSFMVTSVLQAGKYTKDSDIIIASSPTFFSVISAWYLSKRYKVPYIFEVRDLWPAIFKDLGILKNKLILSILENIELFLYQQAKYIVTVTDSFTKNIIKRGIDKEKVFTITNGVNLDQFFPKEKNNNLINELNLEKKFIILYIGAHGISQGLSSIVDTAKILENENKIHFLFVGEGADKENIVNKASALNLKNITFLKGQPKEKVIDFYSIMDIGLVPLRNIPLFKTFIPSKMFEMLAMKKPIVASVEGEAASILKKSQAALIGNPENATEIASNILILYKNKYKYKQYSENGLTFVKQHYNRKTLAATYINKLLLS